MAEQDEFDAMSRAMLESVSPETTAEAPVEEVPNPEAVAETNAPEVNSGATDGATVETEGPITISFGEEVEKSAEVSKELKEIIAQRDAALARLEEKEKTNVFANEQLRKLNDYVLNGGKIDKNFWDLQEKDYSQVDFTNDQSLMSVLKDKLMLVDGLTDREADRMIKKQYPTLSDKEGRDSADEDDILDEMLALKTTVRGELPKLQEIQNRAALPKEDKEAQRRAQESLQLYQAEADKALSGIDKFELKLTDGFAVNLAKDKETEKSLRNLILYPENQSSYFVDNYVKDGKVDFQRFAQDEFFRIHRERIVKTAFDQGVSYGKKEVIQKELRQENPTVQKSNQSQGASDGWQERLFQTLESQTKL